MPVASVANQKANAGYRLNFKSQLAGMRHKKKSRCYRSNLLGIATPDVVGSARARSPIRSKKKAPHRCEAYKYWLPNLDSKQEPTD
jgi:hypothetical protein